MSKYFDELETRSADERAAHLAIELPALISHAKQNAPSMRNALLNVDARQVNSRDALSALPVLRKSALIEQQTPQAPLGGYDAFPEGVARHFFQSPGPIYEPGRVEGDWWRFGRAVYAAGIRAGDVVQNCFSYHLTPAGMMFDSGARAVGANVVPAGVGQTDMQVRAAADLGATAYAGTPDFLKVILDRADETGVNLSSIKRAIVGGGALFPSLRAEYADRGIACLQGYGTADLGSIAYETEAMEGMVVDEGVVLEIVRPGTGDPVADGEVGEVVVTILNLDYPLIRFATGDLSAVMAGQSPCGRTNMRIKGWMGRADQTTKIKGMFVRPEQVAELVGAFDEIAKARIVAGREGEQDTLSVRIEVGADSATDGLARAIEARLPDILKLRGSVELLRLGELPNDGLVIEDTRSYD